MRKPSMGDVAKLAGVSKATVSHVVNKTRFVSEETEARVTAAMQSLSYYPSAIARSLRTKRTGTIGVMVSDISNPFFTAVVRSIQDVLSREDYKLFLYSTNEDPIEEEQYLQALQAQRVDGLIVAPTGHESRTLSALYASGTAIVLLDRKVSFVDCPTVCVDNENGAYQAVKHLIRDGHRRIGIVTGLLRISTSHERLQGYARALEENHIHVEESLIKQGDSRTAGGFQRTMELLSSDDPPTAVFTTNNLMTLGALRAFRQKELRCPEDVAIVGFDDHDWAPFFSPPLTVVRQPTYELGVAAAELVIRLVKGEALQSPPEALATELIVRDSCNPGGHH